MAGFSAFPGGAQVVMQYLLDNQPVENVWWFQGTTTWSLITLGALAAAMNAWEVAHPLPARTSNCAFTRVIATDWSTEFGVQATNESGLPLDGDQVNPLPNHNTCAIKFNTSKRGRSYRGRHFWIGLDRSFTSDNTLTSGFLSNLIGYYNDIAAAVTGINGAQHVVFSQFQNKVRINPGVATVITAYTVNQFIDSQRRRLPGHNRHR